MSYNKIVIVLTNILFVCKKRSVGAINGVCPWRMNSIAQFSSIERIVVFALSFHCNKIRYDKVHVTCDWHRILLNAHIIVTNCVFASVVSAMKKKARSEHKRERKNSMEIAANIG